MEVTTDDSTDKDKGMKSTFESFADNKNTKKEKKVPKLAPSAFETILKTDTDKENDGKKPTSLLEMLGAETSKTDKTPDKLKDEPKTEVIKENAEEVVPLEELGEVEKTEVVQGYIDNAVPEIISEIGNTEPSSVEEAEAVASQAFLDQLQRKINNGDDLGDDSIEGAGQDALEELDIEAVDESEADQTAEEIEVPQEAPDEELEDDSDVNAPASPTPLPVVVNPIPQPINRNAQAPPPIVPSNAPINTPLMPNMPSPNNANFNVTPVKNLNKLNPNVIDRRRDAKNLLVGALVGYMVGRRRGRIKTENRLLPIQHKLEKQVGDLHDKLSSEELKVRRLAAMQFEQNQVRSLKQLERIQELRESRLKPKNTLEVTVQPGEGISDKTIEPSRSSEKAAETLSGGESKVSSKSVEAMTLPLLLSLAETIVIGETSLRTMYEKGRLDQRQLRRFVKEYLNGEKIDKIMPELIAGQEVINEQKLNRLSDDNVPGASEHEDNERQDRQLESQEPIRAEVPDNNLTSSPQPITQYQFEQDKKISSPTIILVILAVITGIVVILVAR